MWRAAIFALARCSAAREKDQASSWVYFLLISFMRTHSGNRAYHLIPRLLYLPLAFLQKIAMLDREG
jgi:hypothetical protein